MCFVFIIRLNVCITFVIKIAVACDCIIWKIRRMTTLSAVSRRKLCNANNTRRSLTHPTAAVVDQTTELLKYTYTEDIRRTYVLQENLEINHTRDLSPKPRRKTLLNRGFGWPINFRPFSSVADPDPRILLESDLENIM